jgi:hypothetical protein
VLDPPLKPSGPTLGDMRKIDRALDATAWEGWSWPRDETLLPMPTPLGPVGEAGRPLPRHSTELGGTIELIATVDIPRNVSDVERACDLIIEELHGRVAQYATVYGYWVKESNTTVDMGPDGPTRVRIDAEIVERLDGHWGEVRQALIEDQEDRDDR